MNDLKKKYRRHNNNKLSVKNALGPKNNTETAVYGAPPCPEMTFQSGNSAKPMGRQPTGQVTTEEPRQPMREETARQPDNAGRGSHLRVGGSSE